MRLYCLVVFWIFMRIVSRILFTSKLRVFHMKIEEIRVDPISSIFYVIVFIVLSIQWLLLRLFLVQAYTMKFLKN